MKKILTVLALLVPAAASAQTITDVNSLTYKLTNLGNTFIEVLIGFAVIWIIYQVVMAIVKSGSDDAKTHRTAVIWGIVGLFVIMAIWGLVRILSNTFRTDNNAPINQYPSVQYPNPVP